MNSPRPEGKTVAGRTEHRRAQLIDTAYRLYLERGYRDVTIPDLAAAAGVSAGTVYNYFDNRRAVLAAVIEERFAVAAREVLGEAPGAADTLEEFVDSVIGIGRRLQEFLSIETGMLRFAMFEAPAVDQDVFNQMLGINDQICMLWTDRLRDGMAKGFLRSDLDSEIMGRTLTWVIAGAALGSLPGADIAPGDEMVQALADLVRFGFGAV
ncbi:TetR/AcrR family transcriptional regulator [Nocardia sputorum]|uniref:TetR family transcriptional regulator n=1 Tax=Nocardia sputorum TaxID=2984338 RepID=A0ABN6U2D6_9NOCA|nr:TetR/AcrR family transcriptional regulator [Nocardia sputorum]BDT99308.1 TetR family transcriptional regulator [Nocardia sputorum]